MIVSIISVLPKIQEAQPRSGLLQSAAITCYVMYITWSAMTNNPSESCSQAIVAVTSVSLNENVSDRSCNPSLGDIINNNISPSGNSTTPAPGQGHAGFDKETIIGLIIWFVCVLYSSIRSSTNASAAKMTGTTEKTLISAESTSSGSFLLLTTTAQLCSFWCCLKVSILRSPVAVRMTTRKKVSPTATSFST